MTLARNTTGSELVAHLAAPLSALAATGLITPAAGKIASRVSGGLLALMLGALLVSPGAHAAEPPVSPAPVSPVPVAPADTPATSVPVTPVPGTTETPASAPEAPVPPAPPAPPAAPAGPRVALKTSFGEIVLELNQEKAPKSTANFLAYVKEGFYRGTIFHRVIPGFMVQGGGFTTTMVQKPTKKPIENEAKNGLKNEPYSVAMARTSDPHSASSQFFINVSNNEFLNAPGRDGWGYAVFGKVVKGFEVVDKIKGVATGNAGQFQNVPLEPVQIESATLLK